MTTSCVVTGGARGIGRGIAELMVARGHRVVVGDLDADAAAATAAEIGAAAGVAMDVRDPDAHRAVAAEASAHGRLVAWFNNAGVGDDGTLASLSDDQVRRLVEVNLLGAMWGCRAALAAFGPGGGDVVNVASLAGLGPVPGYSAYAATKAAVVSLSASVNAESPRGVRVHALCPDGVDTAMLAAQDPYGHGLAADLLRRADPRRGRGGRGRRRPRGLASRGAYAARLARGRDARRHAQRRARRSTLRCCSPRRAGGR